MNCAKSLMVQQEPARYKYTILLLQELQDFSKSKGPLLSTGSTGVVLIHSLNSITGSRRPTRCLFNIFFLNSACTTIGFHFLQLIYCRYSQSERFQLGLCKIFTLTFLIHGRRLLSAEKSQERSLASP